MYPYLEIAGHEIASYSVMAAVGLIAAMIFIFVRTGRKNVDFFQAALFFLLMVSMGALGAWLMYVAVTAAQMPEIWGLLLVSPSGFFSKTGTGFVYYGGLLGMLGGIGICRRIIPDDTDTLLYASVPAIPLFHIFGRIGCYLAGCCYGIRIDGRVVPVQLYESAGNLVIFMVLMLAGRHNGNSRKQLGLYMVMYGIMRFMLEFLRGDEIRGHLGIFSTSQWLSIAVIIPVGIYNLYRSAGMTASKRRVNGVWQ